MVKKVLALFLALGFVVSGVSFAVEGQDIVKFGEDVEIGRGMEVDSAVAIGGSVTVSGKVKGDAVAIGGSLYLKDWSEVGGNAVSIGGKVDSAAKPPLSRGFRPDRYLVARYSKRRSLEAAGFQESLRGGSSRNRWWRSEKKGFFDVEGAMRFTMGIATR